jgi:hypothetical protein
VSLAGSADMADRHLIDVHVLLVNDDDILLAQ